MKKLATMALSVGLIGAMVAGGSLAYLTSADRDTNVMTLGNVQIEQIEQERDANGALVDFTQNKPLFPGTTVDKIVNVKNIGRSDAYVRTVIAYEGVGEYGPAGGYINVSSDVKEELIGEFIIGGTNYTVYSYTYTDALKTGATTTASSLEWVAMDKTATNETVAKYGDTYDILVVSQAVQTAGFDSAATALEEAFPRGENNENVPGWFNGMITPDNPGEPSDPDTPTGPVYVTGDIDTTSESGSYGYKVNPGEKVVFKDVEIVTSGGGISVWGTAEFNSGSIVNNSLSTSSRHLFYVAGGDEADGYLTINGGEFKFSPDNLTRKGFYICAHGEGATVIVNGGKFYKPSTRSDADPRYNYKAGIGAYDGGSVTIYGGEFQFDPSNWVAEGYQAVEADGWWTVSAK